LCNLSVIIVKEIRVLAIFVLKLLGKQSFV
jgi:hypothetical protein